ncbi:MAG: hypothetical protein PVJ92_02315 [Candidatus Dependentiae bacterium]|jgi:tetratricopeptide (TPR) repeat protein
MSDAKQQPTFVESFFEQAVAYRRQLFIGAFAVAVLAGSVGGYWWYRQRIASQAHKAYAEAAALINARIVGANDSKGLFETAFMSEEERWQAVADAFKRVSDNYPHVGMGGLAAVARVQALVRLNKMVEARAELADALPRIASAPLRALYTQTLALMQLDSAQDSEREKGLVSLQQLAANKDGVVHDSALYHLGSYYWHHQDFDNARNYWQQLLLGYEGNEEHPSDWVAAAKEKLSLIERA